MTTRILTTVAALSMVLSLGGVALADEAKDPTGATQGRAEAA